MSFRTGTSGTVTIPIQLKEKVITCYATLKAWSIGSHKGWAVYLIWLAHSDFEGTAYYMAPIELHIDRMNAVFSWNEPNSIFVCKAFISKESLDLSLDTVVKAPDT